MKDGWRGLGGVRWWRGSTGWGRVRRALGGVLVAAFLGGLPTGARAQEARELSVAESIRLGLENNAGLQAAEADADAAAAVYRQVRAAQLPAVRGQGTYTRLSDNIPPVEFTIPGTDSTVTFQGVQLDRLHGEVSVEVPLLTQLRLRHETRAAARDASAAELMAEQRRSDIAFEIRRAYWTLYRSRAVRDLTAAAIEQVDEHLREVRQRREAGAALTRDVLAAQTRRSEVLLERVEADNEVRVAQLELNRLLGLPLATRIRTSSDVEVVPPEGPVYVESEGAVLEGPQIGALTQEVRGLEERLESARAARLPDVDFIGRYVYSRPNPYFFAEQDEFRGTWELMLSARWGIWEGDRVSARAREARARVASARARLEETTEEVAVEVARRRLEVQRATEAMEVAAQNVREAEESYRVVRQQYEEGAALSTDVLDAEEALRRANARRARALADYAIGRAAVLNTLGRVW